jgi:hypothetical protein
MATTARNVAGEAEKVDKKAAEAEERFDTSVQLKINHVSRGEGAERGKAARRAVPRAMASGVRRLNVEAP